MKKNFLLILGSLILAMLAAYMIYLGSIKNLIPPTITGIGFLVIAYLFLALRNK